MLLKIYLRKKKEIEASINDANSKLNKLIKGINQNEVEYKNNEMIRIRNENQLAQVEENIKKNTAKLDVLGNEMEYLSKQRIAAKEESEQYLSELSSIEESITITKHGIEEYKEKNKEKLAKKDSLHQDITSYKIVANSNLEK